MEKEQYDIEQRRAFTDANRKAWDQAATIHEEINQRNLIRSVSDSDYCMLPEHCIAPLTAIGLGGKSIAQLCCNNGTELLSLKSLGAGYCIGFDATLAFIEQARELSAVSPYDEIDFVVTDIYDVPSQYLGPYDIVLSTVGVISWMPNLQELFEVYGAMTKPGGYMFIEDMHPVLMMYEEGDSHNASYLNSSYFKQGPWKEESGLDYYEGRQYKSSPHYSFQHTLSEIMQAAMQQGFVLRQFDELGYDISTFCADLENAEALPPMGMTMTWQKSETGF